MSNYRKMQKRKFAAAASLAEVERNASRIVQRLLDSRDYSERALISFEAAEKPELACLIICVLSEIVEPVRDRR